ncbi:MAG: DUF4142 domain-containing protein, partial [Acidobacteriota bacterium]|nr:DUF4142 domain-containing protein [Acidobacteriota bacterium]
MKKLQTIGMGLFILTAGSFAAFAQSPKMPTAMTQAAKTVKQGKFLSEAAQGGMTEIELSQMALEKSQNEEIKKYAQMMIEDHTKAGDELKT